MSKKNRKNNRKADNKAVRTSSVNIEVTTSTNRIVLIAKFDYIKNTFYCPCGGKMFWTGGRFSNNHTMEVLVCEHCGRSTDPSMVMEAALNIMAQWEAVKANYFATAAKNAAAVRKAEKRAARQAYDNSLRGRIRNFFGMVPAFSY